jgi:hypothetical protein
MTTKHALAVAVSSLVIAAATPALANTDGCVKADEAAAKSMFEKWAAALPGHNEDLVLDFYTRDHSFKPHTVEAALTERQQIRDWWREFVDSTPTVELGQSSVSSDCNSFVKSGVKTIKAGDETITANFVMEYVNEGGAWLIKRHELTPATN